jgi:predicted RNA binding protein YcfA (HicA-like mRNA interferase family)
MWWLECVYASVMSMSSREIIKALEAAGWRRVRVRGDHHQFKHEGSPYLVTVPHPTRDVPTGTLRSIEKASGLPLGRKRR